MQMRKLIVVAVGVSAMTWSFVASASEVWTYWAQNKYWEILDDNHNYCVLLWTYDPSSNSNYSNCIVAERFNSANAMYVAASLNDGNQFPEAPEYNMGATYRAIANALYYYY